ncbi:MAG TPA: aldehyde dehydrogenase family protein [Methanoregulaceae archaeon]|nr:aldehyde dehydrogenase family protein [Methanoregulaceae archaeon]
MLINGERVDALDGRTFTVSDPATGEMVATLPFGGIEDVRAAVDSAETAQPGWAGLSPRNRAQVLLSAARLIRGRVPNLARTLTREQGKPLREASDEIRGTANVFEYYAGLGSAFRDEFHRIAPDLDAEVLRQPIGVCAAVIPWNMPALLFAWKTAPALLCGNSLVLKPASTAPLTPLALAGILHEAGLHPGLLNVVTGSGDVVGEALVRERRVRKVSFTGSTGTGRRVLALAAEEVKRVTLELGGSDPMIVCEDADLGRAVAGAVAGRFYNCGQVCTAVKRLFVHEAIADEFTRRLVDGVGRLTLGHGLEPATKMGPLNSIEALERIERLVDETRERESGRVIVGGSRTGEAGNFYEPTVVTDVVEESRLLSEEVFGPVIPLVRFGDLNEAILRANRSPFGLGASIWTRNPSYTREASRRLEAGIVWVNLHLKVPPEVPFGGMKQSGLGRENGVQALEAWSETKTVLLRD